MKTGPEETAVGGKRNQRRQRAVARTPTAGLPGAGLPGAILAALAVVFGAAAGQPRRSIGGFPNRGGHRRLLPESGRLLPSLRGVVLQIVGVTKGCPFLIEKERTVPEKESLNKTGRSGNGPARPLPFHMPASEPFVRKGPQRVPAGCICARSAGRCRNA